MENQNAGALWLKVSKNGLTFMSGVIEIAGQKHKIVVFKNKQKKTDKHPDYQILLSEDRQQGQQRQEQPPKEEMPTIQTEESLSPEQAEEAWGKQEINTEDIPF